MVLVFVSLSTNGKKESKPQSEALRSLWVYLLTLPQVAIALLLRKPMTNCQVRLAFHSIFYPDRNLSQSVGYRQQLLKRTFRYHSLDSEEKRLA